MVIASLYLTQSVFNPCVYFHKQHPRVRKAAYESDSCCTPLVTLGSVGGSTLRNITILTIASPFTSLAGAASCPRKDALQERCLLEEETCEGDLRVCLRAQEPPYSQLLGFLPALVAAAVAAVAACSCFLCLLKCRSKLLTVCNCLKFRDGVINANFTSCSLVVCSLWL